MKKYDWEYKCKITKNFDKYKRGICAKYTNIIIHR